MAKARIKLGRLLFRDYAKYDYGTGTYPTVTRRWSNIPLDAAYDMEKKKHPDYEVFYDPDEIPYSKMIKQEEIDDIEIDKILKGDTSGDKVDSKLDLNNDGKFDEKDLSIASGVLRRGKKFKNKR